MIILSDSPLAECWNHYDEAKLTNRSGSTKKHYRIVRQQFAQFLTREPMISDLNDCSVNAWLSWLLTRIAPVTANQRRHYMLCFWRWCCRRGYVEVWPEVPRVPEPDRIPRGWQLPQIGRILEACRSEPGYIGGIMAKEWWTAIHWFWWHSGERSGATLQIRLDAVDWITGEIDVPGTVRKAGKAERHWMGWEAMEALRKIKDPQREKLFPWPHDIGTLYNRLKGICRRAGLPYRPPKAMRISFASHLEANGGNATEALQHSSRTTTRKSYLDPSIVTKPRACDRMPRLE